MVSITSVLSQLNWKAPLVVPYKTFGLSIFCVSVEHPATSRRFIEFGRWANDLNNWIFLNIPGRKSYSLRMCSDKNLSRLSWFDASFNLKLVLSGSEKRFKLFRVSRTNIPVRVSQISDEVAGKSVCMNFKRIPNFGGTIYYDVKHDGTQRDFQMDVDSMTVSVL